MTSLVKNGRLRRQWRVPLGGVWLVGTAHWAGTIEPGWDPNGLQGTCSCGSSHLHWRFLKEIFKNFPRTREHTQGERFKKNKKKTNSFWWVGVLRKYFSLISLYFLTINYFVFFMNLSLTPLSTWLLVVGLWHYINEAIDRRSPQWTEKANRNPWLEYLHQYHEIQLIFPYLILLPRTKRIKRNFPFVFLQQHYNKFQFI